MKKLIIIAAIAGLVGGIYANAKASNNGLRLGQQIAGDTNCDGYIVATDALATLRVVTGLDPALTVRQACR